MKSAVRMIRIEFAALASFALGACTSLPVTTDVNPNASVGSCHTYAWAQEHITASGAQGAFGNPLNADRLRVAIGSNLAARGIQPAADYKTADCVVGYAIGTRVVADPYVGWGVAGYGWGRRGWGWGYGWDYPYVHDEGRISVDLFDAKTHTAIWHGSVNQYVGDTTGPSAELRINQAAAAIFTKFPVIASPAMAPAAAPRNSPTA